MNSPEPTPERQNSRENKEFQMPLWLPAILGVALVGMVIKITTTKQRSRPVTVYQKSQPFEETLPKPQKEIVEVTTSQVAEIVSSAQTLSSEREFTDEQRQRLRYFEGLSRQYEGQNDMDLGNGLTVIYGNSGSGGISVLKKFSNRETELYHYNEVHRCLVGSRVVPNQNTDGSSIVNIVIILFPEFSPEQFFECLEEWERRRPTPTNFDTDSRSDVPEKSHPETR